MSKMSEYHDFKEMYLIMAREMEQAIRILVAAQQKCEELYLSGTDTEIKLLNFEENQQGTINTFNK